MYYMGSFAKTFINFRSLCTIAQIGRSHVCWYRWHSMTAGFSNKKWMVYTIKYFEKVSQESTKVSPLSIASLNFSMITNKQCWARTLSRSHIDLERVQCQSHYRVQWLKNNPENGKFRRLEALKLLYFARLKNLFPPGWVSFNVIYFVAV